MEIRAKVERDDARHEVVMVRLETEVAGSARAQVESKLARVQHLSCFRRFPAEDGV